MAALLGITLDNYTRVEPGRRIHPATSAERFAALLPLLLHEPPMPLWNFFYRGYFPKTK